MSQLTKQNDQNNDAVDKSLQSAQYAISAIPYHTHNGVDSPLVQSSISSKTTTGQADRVMGAASSSQIIAHGLGKIPTFVKITGFTLQGGVVSSTVGTYDGTTMNFVSVQSGGVNWGTGFIVAFTDGTNLCTATVALTTTNMTLTWTKTGTGASGTLHFIWTCS